MVAQTNSLRPDPCSARGNVKPGQGNETGGPADARHSCRVLVPRGPEQLDLATRELNREPPETRSHGATRGAVGPAHVQKCSGFRAANLRNPTTSAQIEARTRLRSVEAFQGPSHALPAVDVKDVLLPRLGQYLSKAPLTVGYVRCRRRTGPEIAPDRAASGEDLGDGFRTSENLRSSGPSLEGA